MFELDYRIVHSEYDDFVGQHGFFQIKCNGFLYGEIYPNEVEVVMDKVSLYDWFERLAKVAKDLMTRDYVVLSDVESYNTWIEFQKRDNKLIISIIKAKKEQGSHDIEFEIGEAVAGEWTNQTISFIQFKGEVVEKGKKYIQDILSFNKENILIDKIRQEFDEIIQQIL